MAIAGDRRPSGSFNGAELEKALAAGQLDAEPAHLTGMIKASDRRGHVRFARGGCDSWVEIPTEMIAEATQVGRSGCRDHEHPLVRLRLVEPADPQAKVLWQLLSATPSVPIPPHVGIGLERQARPGFQNGLTHDSRGQCSSWCSGSTLWCMCPVHVPGFGTAYAVYPCGTCINDPVFTA